MTYAAVAIVKNEAEFIGARWVGRQEEFESLSQALLIRDIPDNNIREAITRNLALGERSAA